MKKYQYHIKNLDCVTCANIIEKNLEACEEYHNVSVNFSKLTLSFSSDFEGDLLRQTQKKISAIEKGVIVSERVLEQKMAPDIFRIVIGSLLFLFSMIFSKMLPEICFVLYLFSYGFLLKNTFINAILLLKKGILNENFLITISAIGAFIIDKPHEGFAVIFLYEIGKLLEKKATGNVRKNVASLMDIEPNVAHKVVSDKIEDLAPNDILLGDVLVIPKGDKIPLDGTVLKGESFLNTSSLTGESQLLFVKKGDDVLSGSINEGEVITITVTSLYQDSTVKKILDLMEHATDKKTKTENFVSRAARVYTPIMLGVAFLIFLITPFLFHINFQESLYRSLMILVVSCPCAIAISVPLCYFAGIGSMSKHGILVKGSNYIDVLKKMNRVVFDKTGTLTTGNFSIKEIVSLTKEVKKDEVLTYILYGESFSNHPLAKSIMKQNNSVIVPKLTKETEVSGGGVTYQYKKDFYKVGSASFVHFKGEILGTTIFVSKNDQILGYLVVVDAIKDSAKEVVYYLNAHDIKTIMFTGDNEVSAKYVASEIGVTHYEANMLPNDKFEKFELLKKTYPNEAIVFVGDGINDAPVLALSDCGISMGSGSASAIDASDVVIMSSDIKKIEEAHEISSKTIRILKQNLVFALGIKFLVIFISFFGIGTMWLAVFADVGVTLLAILNSLRILK